MDIEQALKLFQLLDGLPVAQAALGAAMAGLAVARGAKASSTCISAAARGAAQGAAARGAEGDSGDHGGELQEKLEETLHVIGISAGLVTKPSVTTAKALLRDRGPEGLPIASRLGRLSKARNTAGHPDTELKRDIEQFFGTDGDVKDSTHDELKTQIQALEENIKLTSEQEGKVQDPIAKSSPAALAPLAKGHSESEDSIAGIVKVQTVVDSCTAINSQSWSWAADASNEVHKCDDGDIDKDSYEKASRQDRLQAYKDWIEDQKALEKKQAQDRMQAYEDGMEDLKAFGKKQGGGCRRAEPARGAAAAAAV